MNFKLSIKNISVETREMVVSKYDADKRISWYEARGWHVLMRLPMSGDEVRLKFERRSTPSITLTNE